MLSKAYQLKNKLTDQGYNIDDLLELKTDELLEQRYSKFRVLGKFIESSNIEEIYNEVPTKSD